MTPDIVYDQLIGAGCARKLIFSWGGNPGVGSLHRFRDAVEHGWPRCEIEEHSHAGMANRYVAGASGLPFAVLRGYNGTDLPEHTDTIKPITCPFTGEQLTAVPALDLDVGDHPRAAGRPRRATSSCGASPACRRRRCSAPKRSLVTVEEIVDELDAAPGRASCCRAGSSTRVAEVPGGAQPVLRAGLLRPRQRRLPGVGRDLAATASAFDAWLDERARDER